MNAIAPLAVPAADTAHPAPAFASVTLWCHNGYFLQVHHGYFDSWEEAEDFAADDELRLEERSGAVFIVHGRGAAFVPDGALQVYRSIEASALRSVGMDLDDLLEVVHLHDLRCIAMGHAQVTRDRPIVARPMYDAELASRGPAANDAA